MSHSELQAGLGCASGAASRLERWFLGWGWSGLELPTPLWLLSFMSADKHAK